MGLTVIELIFGLSSLLLTNHGDKIMKFKYCESGECQSETEITSLEQLAVFFKQLRMMPEDMNGTVWRSIFLVDENTVDETFGEPMFCLLTKRTK